MLRALLTDAETPASFGGTSSRPTRPRSSRPGAAAAAAVGRRRRRPAAGGGRAGRRRLELLLGDHAEDYRRGSGCWPPPAGGRPGPGGGAALAGLTTLVGTDADDLVARWDRLRADPGRDPRQGRAPGLGRLPAGRHPDEIVAQLRDWEALGVEQVISRFAGLPFSVFEDEQLELASELVLPRL